MVLVMCHLMMSAEVFLSFLNIQLMQCGFIIFVKNEQSGNSSFIFSIYLASGYQHLWCVNSCACNVSPKISDVHGRYWFACPLISGLLQTVSQKNDHMYSGFSMPLNMPVQTLYHM